MTKVLSQAGSSLADIYDVEGSIAGIDQLLTDELPIVHEMGGTVFSERLSGEIVRLSTGALAQSVAFDVILTSPPINTYRLLGLFVFADVNRVSFAQVSLRNTGTDREIPLWWWDTTASINDVSSVRMRDNGAAAATHIALNTPQFQLPSLAIRSGQLQETGGEIVFRGEMTAFGAGTVTATAILYLGLTDLPTAGLSSRGLPIPSW